MYYICTTRCFKFKIKICYIMGLFSFLKGAGKEDLAKKEAEAKSAMDETNRIAQEALLNSQKQLMLQDIVRTTNVEIEDLGIKLVDGTVTVTGNVDTQEHKEKVILALGNVNGIATVDDQMTVTNPADESDFYEVKSGDTLSKIAKAYYGDPMRYKEIFEANQPMLKNADLIYPGQTLRIPKK